MAWFSISDVDKGARLVSYTASAAAKAKATTLTVKVEVSDADTLGFMMSQLAALQNAAKSEPKKRAKRLALPSPDAVDLD